MRRADRAGFTLIEMLVAMTVASVVVTGAYRLLSVLITTEASITRERVANDSEMNAEVLLTDLFARAEAGTTGTEPFVGTPEEAAFDTWCDGAGGWLERCRATLRIDRADGDPTIVVLLDMRETARIRPTGFLRTLVYEERSRSSAAWATGWGRSLVLPAAIGIVSDLDTLVYSIGVDR